MSILQKHQFSKKQTKDRKQYTVDLPRNKVEVAQKKIKIVIEKSKHNIKCKKSRKFSKRSVVGKGSKDVKYIISRDDLE